MTSIGAQTSSLSQLSLKSEVLKKNQEATEETPEKSAISTPTEGIKVSLSGVGLQKAADRGNANQDIEESGLPDSAQRILKMIREIKQKIAEKQAELQALMTDQSTSPELKQSQIRAVQTALNGLTSSLLIANASLEKLSKNGSLSDAQSQQASMLAMKG